MPGLRLASFWEGDRSELFATYILSSVAAVVPVPRQVDFGIDLLCTLTRHEGKALYAGPAFAVQIKSESARQICYGGLDRHGKWKSHELQYLFGQDQPLILCVVSLDEWRVRLYSTARIWWVLWQRGNQPGEIVLDPDLDLDERRSLRELYESTPLQGAGDGFSYRVPLGPPIVDVVLSERDIDDQRQVIRTCIESWVELDYRNIRHRKMGVPYFEDWLHWQPNTPPNPTARIWHFWNPVPGYNVPGILRSISPAVTNLMMNLQAQGQTEELHAVVPLAGLLQQYEMLDPMGSDFLKANAQK